MIATCSIYTETAPGIQITILPIASLMVNLSPGSRIHWYGSKRSSPQLKNKKPIYRWTFCARQSFPIQRTSPVSPSLIMRWLHLIIWSSQSERMFTLATSWAKRRISFLFRHHHLSAYQTSLSFPWMFWLICLLCSRAGPRNLMPVVSICAVLQYMSILKEIGIGLFPPVCIDPVTAALLLSVCLSAASITCCALLLLLFTAR